jgi:outer membrane protein
LSLKFTIPAIALGTAIAAFSQTAPTKVGIINIQSAIISTRDGQKAAADLQNRFTPKKEEIDKRQGEIQSLQEQLKRGSNTMSEEARNKLVRDIDERSKRLARDTEDAQAEFDHEQGRVMQDVGGKMMAVLDKYAKDNGFAVILDVSSQATPVLWAATATDITKDIIDLYDQSTGAPAASAPAAAPKPAAPAGGAANRTTAPPAATPPPAPKPAAKK